MTDFVILVVLFYFLLLLLDIILFVTFRNLMFSFLLSKRNPKSAREIHLSQDRSNRFTFKYIENHATYKKAFQFFHKFYMVNLYFIPFQYLSVIIFNFISLKITFLLQAVFCIIKLICNFILRTQQNSNRIFKFDKRYQ